MPQPASVIAVATVETLVTEVRQALAGAQDPGRAPQMQAYMKSDLPYFGIPSPALKAVLRPLLAKPLSGREEWETAVRLLWDDATHREEWYAALALAGHRHYRAFQGPASLRLYRYLVTTGLWWDVVDDLATHKVGPVLRAHRADVTPVIMAWATDEELWLRRTALICQVGAKHETDTQLLAHALSTNLEDSTYGEVFWIRKAVGWALRQYARTDPAWVRAYVEEHGSRLSGLSKREALKHL